MSQVKSSMGEGVEISLSWQNASNGFIPCNSINAGDSYVARAVHNGERIPGKVVRGEGKAYICYDSKEISSLNYEVLVDTHNLEGCGYEWKCSNGSVVPKGAIVGGSDKGRPLYVARGSVEGKLLSGKFQPENGCTYIPYDSLENRKENFEVLCFVNKHI